MKIWFVLFFYDFLKLQRTVHFVRNDCNMHYFLPILG